MKITEFLKNISYPEERWCVIEEFPDYWVSSLGRVVSTKYNKMQLLRPCILQDKGREYSYVFLSGTKKAKIRIHRLVATAFLDNPNNLKEIDHINNIGTDNRVCNLRWCTHKENMNNPHTVASLRDYKLAHPYKPDLTVFCYDHAKEKKRVGAFLDGVLVKEYNSLGEAEKDGFVKCSVSAACHGRIRTYRGYVWKILS